MSKNQYVRGITKIERYFGNPYPNLDAVDSDLLTFLRYKLCDAKIHLVRDGGSIPKLRCFIDSLLRAETSIMKTPGDKIKKTSMLRLVKNYRNSAGILLESIEQAERGYEHLRNGLHEAGVRYHKKQKRTS